MQQQFHGSDQTKVRPAFRILGTLVFSILAVVFAADIVQLLTANKPTFRLETCSGKGAVVCELGNWLSSAIPVQIRIPLEISSRIFLSLVSLFIAARLVWPRSTLALPSNL